MNEDMADLLCSVKNGDIVDMDEIRYCFRDVPEADLVDVNLMANEYGIRVKQLDEDHVIIIDRSEVDIEKTKQSYADNVLI